MLQKLFPCILFAGGASMAAVSGYVKLPDATPVSGAQVQLLSTSESVSTDASGYFVFTGTTAWQGTKLAENSISGSGNAVLLNLSQNSRVSVSVFSALGKRVGGFDQMLSAGSHEFLPVDADAATGIYLVKVRAGDSHKTFRLRKSAAGNVSMSAVHGEVLAKTLVSADSLVVTYENQRAGAVAVWDDDASVGNILITHKVVSGSIPSSATWDYSVTVSLSGSDGSSESLSATVRNFSKTYSATSTWRLYDAARTWTVAANGSSVVAVADAVQSVSIDIEGASSSSEELSSSSAGGSPASSSAASSSSSYTLQTMYATQPDSIWKFVDWVWANRQSSGHLDDIERSSNLIFHQIIAGEGKINYCVRWQSVNSLSYDQRRTTEKMLNTMLNKWVKELVGYEDWPYDTVIVKVVGWAADNASKFPNATADEKIFTSYTETDASFPSLTLPRCPDACARPLHYAQLNYDYSQCEMGERFDMSLWVTDGFNGGAGGDWGQRGSYSDFVSGLSLEFPHIIGHETGHGFGLDDFYETYQIPNANYDALTCYDYASCESSGYAGNWSIVPKMVMWAGSSSEITAADAWMLRRTWTGVKSQFGY